MKHLTVLFAAVAWVVLWLPVGPSVHAAVAEARRFTQDRFVIGMWVPPATNEVALITASPAKMIEFEIFVDGSLMEDFRADGVIIATSTGSTAYAMSAGGPIVDPRVDAIVMVPMAPFKLSSRPWVIPGDSTLEVKLKLPLKEALVVIDGQSTTTISISDSLIISKADTPARFVKVAKDGFFEKVKSKLA